MLMEPDELHVYAYCLLSAAPRKQSSCSEKLWYCRTQLRIRADAYAGFHYLHGNGAIYEVAFWHMRGVMRAEHFGHI